MVKEYIDDFRNKNIWEQNDGDFNRLDANGFAPVHYAAKFNHFEIMKMLIEAEDVKDLELHEEGPIRNHLRSGSGKRSTSFPVPPLPPTSLYLICHNFKSMFKYITCTCSLHVGVFSSYFIRALDRR